MIARRVLLSLVAIFIAVLAIRTPQHARSGLDAAWSLALSVAHTDRLVFGRDIAFTFGPLGYLVIGIPTTAVLGDIARFSALVAIVYAGCAYVAISSPMSITQRIALTAVLIALAASPSGADYLLFFAFLAALGARSLRTPRRMVASALALGTLAGVAAMTKFTLAIDCGGAATLFYLGSILFAARVHTLRWIAAGLTFATAFAAAALAVFTGGLLTIAVAAGAVACAVLACYGSDRRRVVFAAAGVAIALAGIFVFAPAMLDFAHLSLAEAADYSSAMSQPGSPDQLRFALAEFAIVGLLVIALSLEGNIPLAAALAFALFGGFKHGFVRQDGHVFYFAITAAAVCSIGYAALRRPSARRLGFVAFLVSTFALFSVTQSALGLSVLGGVAPASINAALGFLFTVPHQKATLDAENALALAGDRLPEATIARFGRAPVDVEPSEATVAIASGLNWKPVPGLQAYAAYDRPIDSANVASLTNRPPGFVLYSLNAIDGRYPFSDSPQMMITLACRYRSDGTIASTKDGGAAVVLAGPNPDRCTPWQRQERRSVRFDETVPIAHDSRNASEFARIAIRTTYSTTGRLRKTLFRIGDLFMTLKYDDGTTAKFRIIPEAAAIGMIVEPSPRTFEETRALFAGTLLSHVQSLVITTDVPATFGATIDITIEHARRRT